jgi:hypothetical protein
VPLPSKDRRDTRTDTQTGGGVPKYAVKTGSGAMIYTASSTKIGSGIQKLIGWGARAHTHTHTEPNFIFSKYGKEAKNGS